VAPGLDWTLAGSRTIFKGEEKLALSLVEEVKKLQVEEAVALLAEISDGLLKEFNVARGPAGIAGPQGPSGARGPQGPSADTTQIAAAAKDAVREIVAEEMVLCGLVDSKGRAILFKRLSSWIPSSRLGISTSGSC